MTSVGRMAAARSPATTTSPSGAPRIYYLDYALAGSAEGWEAWLGHAASLGFDHLLVPPLAAPAADGDRYAIADTARLHPSLAWATGGAAQLAEACRRRGLALLVDLVLDRVAAGSPLAAAGAFDPPQQSGLLDPRHVIEPESVAQARLHDAGDAERLAQFWAQHLGAARAAGIGGARLLGLDRVPAHLLPALLRSLRSHCPDMLLLAWTPGVAREALSGLVEVGLDYVFSSLPWWDWEADWLWQELDLLRDVAPVITAPEAPYGPRLATMGHGPATLAPLLRRALGLAASLGSGWLMPVGFEAGATRPLDPAGAPTLTPADLRGGAVVDLTPDVIAANAGRAAEGGYAASGDTRLLSGPGGPVLAVLRAGVADMRRAERALLILVNADLATRHRADAASLLAGAAGCFDTFRPVTPPDAEPLAPGRDPVLGPGEVRTYHAAAAPVVAETGAVGREAARRAAAAPRLAIEAVSPTVDEGRFPVKRTVGEIVTVEADVICDGHDKLGVALHWRGPGDDAWAEARMRPLGNDRWQASFPLTRLGTYRYTVEAWRDAFATYRDELGKKVAAGVPVALELQEGVALVRGAAARPQGAGLAALRDALAAADPDRQRDLLLAAETAELMAAADDRPFATRVTPEPGVMAERAGARYASWYEVFPRSLSDDPRRHGTFLDVIRHLPRVRAMGFDVLYFPPIHPIGRTNRKGRNNSLHPAPEDPGSPYAIGAAEGGHDALHPELGTFDDFRRLREEAAAHGIELAIDFAIQCSPDHPWLREHKEWFAWRPDGSIRYAENPPKKYEDIVNVDFYAEGAIPDLWLALCNIVLFWCDQGVRLFRVDNPHTKPFPFWQWMIGEVRARHPDAIFLAEAFTRPKVMYRLAKVGFSQSYTYFTWRNEKRELQEYLTELTTTAPRDFFRPHFFVNTPDINPVFLQTSGRPGFLIRAALAATLSGLWGVYNGFELCEGTPVPGKEEYLDSEKYQLRAWDWDRPGNIVAEIAQLNAIRRMNPALQTHLGVSFHNAWNDAILYYEKATPDRSNVLLAAVSLDPHGAQEADIELPLWKWNRSDGASLHVEDLIGGARFTWHGKIQRIRLTPERPYAIWRVRPAD